MYSIASDGLLKPVLEKQGILGPTNGRRPGDVSIPDWRHHMGLAIDVAVTSPLADRSVRVVSPCEDYALVQKHRTTKVLKARTSTFALWFLKLLGQLTRKGKRS